MLTSHSEEPPVAFLVGHSGGGFLLGRFVFIKDFELVLRVDDSKARETVNG